MSNNLDIVTHPQMWKLGFLSGEPCILNDPKITMNYVIYTSYFANLKRIPKDIIPVSIARKTPLWFTGRTYKKLAPPYELLQQYKENNNSEFYIQYYKKNVLQRLNPSQVVDELTSNGPVVLLCYEKDDFCHRHLVADWLCENGFVCVEYE